MNLSKETESNMENSGTSERGSGRGRVRGGSIRGGVGSRTSRRSSLTSTESCENILVALC